MKNETISNAAREAGLTKLNTVIVASKVPGKTKFRAEAMVYGAAASAYLMWRQKRGISGMHTDAVVKGGQMVMDADTTAEIFALHGLTEESARALANAYADRHYAGDPAALQYHGVIAGEINL